MQISENELWLLSFYRESELAGSLIMGRLARETDDDDLRVRLTEHCAEEARHAWMWTETILAVGGTPQRVNATYQSRYFAALGEPNGLLEILALTQVFEKRVMRHFRSHLRAPGTHPAVAATLRQMMADEVGHVGWVKEWLDRYGAQHGAEVVEEVLQRYTEVDRRVYAELLEHRDDMRALLAPAPPVVLGTRSVADRIRQVAARTLRVSPVRITDDLVLRDAGLDSLDLALLMMAIENELEVELEAAELDGVRTFADLVRRISALSERVAA